MAWKHYKYSKDDYYKILNADCVQTAIALGMKIDEGKQTTSKAIHIKDSGGLYIFPDKNNWYRHTDGAKGFPIDLVMDTLNCDKERAADFMARNVLNGVREQTYIPEQKAEEQKDFKVPPHNIQPNRVMAYLIKTRGIDGDIVKSMIRKKMIAEDSAHHNCLFFGRDKNGEIRSCAIRGTNSQVRFRGEAAGGNKGITFAMIGKNNTLRCFESPIDAMSHATFSKLSGKDWTRDHRLSTNGCGYQSIYNFLNLHNEIKTVWLCFDNDDGGRRAIRECTEKIREDFPEINIKSAVPKSKDWNSDLQNFRTAERQGISARDFLESSPPEPPPKLNVPEEYEFDFEL